MKVFILFAVIFSSALAHVCRPRFHFWRPYNGTIPKDAFDAGLDNDGRKNYIAKIIPLDKYLWTIPAQLKECEHHIDFGWCCGTKDTMRVDKFIEILCTEDSSRLTWRKVNEYVDEISNCCLVQGGIALYEGHVYNAYVGRTYNKGQYYVGRTYIERDWSGVHIMSGSNSTKIKNDYEVLSYDCDYM